MATCVCIGLISCENAQDTTITQTYTYFKPSYKDTSYTVEYVAEIQAVQNIEIRSKIDGYLTDIYVDEGQFAKKGQLLFRLADLGYKQELQKAKSSKKIIEAEVRSASIEFENTKSLFQKNILSKTELDIAEAKLQALEAQLEEAEVLIEQAALNLSLTEIKAPFDGYVNRIPNKIGSLIEEGSLLTSLSDNNEIFAYFYVPENDYLDFINEMDANEATKVQFVLSNNEIFSEVGSIETAESQIDRTSGNIAFRARFKNPKGLIKHGASGKIQIRRELKNVMLIPQQSTFEIQGNLFVFVVDEKGITKSIKINPSYRLSNSFVIQDELTLDDKVIAEGVQRIKEGEQVQLKAHKLSNNSN